MIFVLLLLLMLYLNYLNKRKMLFDQDDDKLRASAFFLSRPVSVAFLIALIVTLWVYPEIPDTIGEMVLLLLLFPLLRLLPGLVSVQLRAPAYSITFLFALNVVLKILSGSAVINRLFLLLITTIAIVQLVWWLKPDNYYTQLRSNKVTRRLSLLLRVVLSGLLISFLANWIGSVNLAHYITTAVIEGATVALVLYAATLIMRGLVIIFMRRRGARASEFMQHYGDRLEHASIKIVGFLAVVVWLFVMLRRWGFLNTLENAFSRVLEHHWRFGTVTISVENIFDFILTLIITFIFVRFSGIILELEVFPRIRLPRGVPAAISMVVRYTIVFFGFFLAISSAGVDLGRFGLLTGALGVGLGFGLRNIIENFVSGIIIAFERPVQVGDTVEIGTAFGNVKEIGVRSSTVTTFDGSEVVIPNASMISNEVTNWTLSNRLRRIRLPVKVDFGYNPHEVTEILLKVVDAHPGVHESPAPLATFNGFGDYFLDFTLYYWISDNILQYKSEVALGVHDAIVAAGIETPRPKRDLNVKMVAEASADKKSN
jgi:small-conductance mechanosensitive channel